MKFQLLLEDLITELSGEEIHQKYYSKLPYDVFLSLVEADPKSIVSGGKIQKMGKWAKLLINLYQKGTLQIEDIYKATEYLEYVYLHQIQVDVSKIKSLADLYNIVKQYILEDKKEFNDVLEMLPVEEYSKIYEGKLWDIYVPKTERAACWLGVNTEWCTQWGPLSLNKKHKDRSNQFSRYSKENDPLYILVDKNDPLIKFQFNFGSKQYMDSADRRINSDTFFNNKNNQEILNFFFPSIYQEDSSQEQISQDFKKADILPPNLMKLVVNKLVGATKDNLLVTALKSNDEDAISRFIQGEKLVSNQFTINDGYLIFYLEDIEGELANYEEVIGYYYSDIDNSWSSVYEDTRDRGEGDYDEELTEIFKNYYEKNRDALFSIGIKEFEYFYKTYYKMWLDKEDVIDDFARDVADNSYESYENAIQSDIDTQTRYLKVESQSYNGGYEIQINLAEMMLFLIKNNLSTILDISSFIDDFIDFHGLSTEYERNYDYNYTYPNYGENNYVTKGIDIFFNKIIENPEEDRICRENTINFYKIKQKYFENWGHEYNVEGQFKVKIEPRTFDCEQNTVRVYYYKRNEKNELMDDYKGTIKIENLVPLITNYKLFESEKLSLLSLVSS